MEMSKKVRESGNEEIVKTVDLRPLELRGLLIKRTAY